MHQSSSCSTLPYLPRYYMSVTEHELQQVLDLLNKELITESLSSCAPLILLTPKKNETWRMYVDGRERDARHDKWRQDILQYRP